MTVHDLAQEAGLDFPGDRGVPRLRAVLNWPLPGLSLGDRVLLRGAALFAVRHVSSIRGMAHILPARDPFILALNHCSRGEAVAVPALLFLLRSGRLIHFLADWNFRMIPGVDFAYRRAGVVTVPHKPARPRFLGAFKPLFTDPLHPLEQAKRHLLAGRSVAIFPEGTVNRDPSRLLRGRPGAARLSIEAGVPVVPAGLRIDHGTIEVRIGAPIPATDGPLTAERLRERHARIMRAIGAISGKAWDFQPRGDKPCD